LATIDAHAVIEPLQAISREIDPERVRERLLAAALELSGARRALLLEEPDGFDVEELPPELLAEVRRTLRPASAEDGDYAYYGLPLLGHQQSLLGILAVLSEREAGPLAPDRVAALTVLASLSALALESARQHAALERENADLREREQALRRSEELYRRAIAQAGAVPYVLDYASGAYTFMGEEILELTGYTAAELTPSLLESMIEESVLLGEQAAFDLEEATDRTRAGQFERWRCDCRIRTRTGETRWMSDASVEIFAEDGSSVGSIGMLQDITERKRTEEEVSRLAAILSATTDVVAMADPAQQVLYVNLAGRRLLEIGEEKDVASLSLPDLFPAGARARVVLEGLPAAARDGVWNAEVPLLRRDGREIPASLVLIAHQDADGTVRFFSTIARDTTERRELEAKLRQAQKMEAIGRLAGGIAHDFNNLLTAIGGYSVMLLDRLDPGDPRRSDVEEIAKAGDLAAALTKQLLVFSRSQALQAQVLDLNAVVVNVERLLRRLIREDITLETRLRSRPVTVRADPGQLSQVLVNLAVNAEDAMPQGGRLTIETAVEAGDVATLSVSDTGVGIDPAAQAQIFEPFFTTKTRGEATGLGLATVFGIVEQSGGHIDVRSEVGAGTTFTISLPRVDELPVEDRAAGEAAEELSGHESVMLVEDDAAVRVLARDVLRLRGYSVVEAANGEEAVRLARTREGPLDLLITDLVMPGMSGRELSEELLERYPGLRVLFMSGYTDDVIFRVADLGPGRAFLQKPFVPGVLARKVREVLGS
jgi:two-component system cell cycle sensor histidine kinase/response regulator CckA